ncbi:MAG TPA: PhzF family phenazine biosynthesis protein [Devosiaceae bacterium]|nr:PhzF family phenazine biosynthesis protein [Devosiaceae bacterium]
MKLNYLLLDVFTSQPLAGNQLAVVLKADGMLDDQMQAIAREFNLSETVFLLKPQVERHTSAVRIFTPSVELPFAGHPTIGAAAVLGLQQRLSAVRIEEKVGLVTCVVERVDKHSAVARFALPQLPEEAGKAPEIKATAFALGIEPEDVGCGVYQPALYSAGVPFYLVPVKNALVLKNLKLNLSNWEQTFPLGRHSVYCFTQTPEEKGNDLAARMFSPGMGLREDPGTGSAAAALIGLLAKHTSSADGQVELKLRQGYEMGRPCQISVQFRKDGDVLTHGGIGGQAMIVGEGTLEFG